MDNLLKTFVDLLYTDRRLLITDKTQIEGVTTLTILGKEIMAEIEFSNDGIFGLIDHDELCHRWQILPTEADMRASIKKLKQLIC